MIEENCWKIHIKQMLETTNTLNMAINRLELDINGGNQTHTHTNTLRFLCWLLLLDVCCFIAINVTAR